MVKHNYSLRKRLKIENACIKCGIDLGDMNPRQYCGKIRCINDNSDTADSDNTNKENIDNESLYEESVDEESVDEESVDEESIDEESVDEESIDEESVDEESIDEESIDEESIDEESVNDKKNSDNVSISIKQISSDVIQQASELYNILYNPEEYSNLSEHGLKSLQDMKQLSVDNFITPDKIINASHIPLPTKIELINRYIVMLSYNIFSEEYRQEYKYILDKIQNVSSLTYNERLLASRLPQSVKDMLASKIHNLHEYSKQSDDYGKLSKYIDIALSVPTSITPLAITMDASVEEKKNFEKSIYDQLNRDIYGMDKVKESILDIAFTFVNRPYARNNIIAIHGPAGVGKTKIAKSIAKCIGLPYARFNLGGAHDASILIGSSKLYIGSSLGKIIQSCIDTASLNPVIHVDEIDKLSKRERSTSSNDIIQTFIHLLDPEANREFVDDYLEFPVDISQVLWVITMNDPRVLGKILLDRITLIEVPAYTKGEKFKIARTHLIPEIIKEVNCDIQIDTEVINYIIEYCNEAGVRELQHNLDKLVRRVNRYMQTDNKEVLGNIVSPYIIEVELATKILRLTKLDDDISRIMMYQ